MNSRRYAEDTHEEEEGERDSGDDYERVERLDYDEHESLLRAGTEQNSLMVNVTNMDEFFGLVYQYFEEKGFWPILMSRLLRLATVLFIIAFSTFLLVFVDWVTLWQCTGAECKNAKVVFFPTSFDDINAFRLSVLVFESVFLCFWIVLLILSVYQVASMIKIKGFYNSDLGVSESEVASITWAELVEKIVDIQRKRPGSISRVKTLDEWGMLSCGAMRKRQAFYSCHVSL